MVKKDCRCGGNAGTQQIVEEPIKKHHFYNIFDIIIDYFKHRLVYIDIDGAKKRYETCMACEYKTKLGTCSKCGCILKLKVKHYKSECPDKRWSV